jgi:amino acid transporter
LTDSRRSFLRDNTGLLREIGPVTAVIVTVSLVIGLAWERNVAVLVASAPLPENLWFDGIPPFVMAFLMGGIILLIIMVGYSILSAAMPRSGGGYVAISRIINPFAGFLAAWFEFLSISWVFGSIAGSVVYNVLYVSGPITRIIPLGTFSDVTLFLGGLLVIAVFSVISAFGLKCEASVLQVLFWVPVVLTVYVVYLLAIAVLNPVVLERGVSAWAQLQGISGVTADTYVKAALAQGLDGSRIADYWTAVSVSLLGAYFCYVGYAATTFVVGEVKEPTKNLPRVLIIASIVVIFMYVSITQIATYAATSVGQTTLPNGDKWSFFEAYSFLSWSGSLTQAGVPPITFRLQTVPEMVGLALGLGNLNILVFLFAVLWIVNDFPAFILTSSRILFAMSVDRVLPASLSKANRFHSPVNAVILVGIFAVLGLLGAGGSCVVCTGDSWSPGGPIGNALNAIFIDGVYSTDLLDVVFFSLFSVAVLLLPFRGKKFFDRTYFKPGGRMGVAAIGLAGVIANLVIGWEVLISPGDSYNILAPNSDNWFAIGFTVLLGLIGCLIYGSYRLGPSRRKVDYSTIFSEIPPE